MFPSKELVRSKLKPSINMASTFDLFQHLIEREDTNQPQKETDEEIDKKAAWKTLSEWIGRNAKSASENVNRIIMKQDGEIECEEDDKIQEFLEPLFPGFNTFGGFVSNKAAFMLDIQHMMTATVVSMTYKHASECIRPYFDGSEAIPVVSLWVIELENCHDCQQKKKEDKITVYGMKLVKPYEESDGGEEVMTPKVYCRLEGRELKVMTVNEIRKGVQCGCGVQGCFAELDDNNHVNAKFISPQGILQLAKGDEGNKIGEMSKDKAISMSFKIANNHYTPAYGPLTVVPQRGDWPIGTHRDMFKLLSMQSRSDSGPYFDYIMRMLQKEWKQEGRLVPNVEGHSAYFAKLASEEEIKELLDCEDKLGDITKGMIYWTRRSEMHKNLTRYKRLVYGETTEDIAVPSRSESRNGETQTRTIHFWTEFAQTSKLLVEQIMSLRLSDREKDKKLLEESETKEFMALQEQRLQLIREDGGMHQKRIAADAMHGIFCEVEQLMKTGASMLKIGASQLKKQKTV